MCCQKIPCGQTDESKCLAYRHLIAENLYEVKTSSLQKLFFKNLEESAKCHQEIPCGQTDESKCLAFRQILNKL